jgi:hypothetical protein
VRDDGRAVVNVDTDLVHGRKNTQVRSWRSIVSRCSDS